MKKLMAIMLLPFVLLLSGCPTGSDQVDVNVAGTVDANLNENFTVCQGTVRNSTLYLRESGGIDANEWAIYDLAADYSTIANTWVNLTVLDSARTYVETQADLDIINE